MNKFLTVLSNIASIEVVKKEREKEIAVMYRKVQIRGSYRLVMDSQLSPSDDLKEFFKGSIST